jgi:pyruvate,orthophosphate dikinase
MTLRVVERLETAGLTRARFGGKGFFLTKLAELGHPVPPFRILESARLHAGDIVLAEIEALLSELRAEAVERMGVSAASVAFAVRSSAPVSMPGMMDTLLGIGLSPSQMSQLAARLGTAHAAWDMVCTGARSLCVHSAGLDDKEIETIGEPGPGAYERLVTAYEQRTGRAFPATPEAQVLHAVHAVAQSWHNDRAREYRRVHRVSETARPSVVIQAMAFGTANGASGSGVIFSHDPLTGERGLHGEYMPTSTGESLVSGTATPIDVATLAVEDQDCYRELAERVDELFRWTTLMVEVEFVVERGRLWLVQLRSAVCTDEIRNSVTVDSWRDGLIDRSEALRRLNLDALFAKTPARAADGSARLLATGLPASAGVATGRFVSHPDDAIALVDEPTVLLRQKTEPEDFLGMVHSVAVVTLEGGTGSHAAVVARELGRPAVVGASFVEPAWVQQADGAIVTVCGTTGRVWLGAVAEQDAVALACPADLIGAPSGTHIVDSLDDVVAAEPDAVMVDGLGALERTSPRRGLVVTADPQVATLIGRSCRVAYIASASAREPWRVALPDVPVAYIVVASAAQRSYVQAALAIREAAAE